MSIHIDEVLDYLDTHPIGCHEGSVKSLMEMLHEVYTMYNSIDSEELRGKFRELRPVLEQLPRDDGNRLFSLICDLCMEHEQLAFSHGIVVGMQLMSEIRVLP